MDEFRIFMKTQKNALPGYLASLAINPQDTDAKTREMISECSSSGQMWWLEYAFHEKLGINTDDILNHCHIVFCRKLVVLYGDLNRWSMERTGICIDFPGFDHNSTVDEEQTCSFIIDCMLKYDKDRYSWVGIQECPSNPGFFLGKYQDLIHTYESLVEHPSHREKPDAEGIDRLLAIIR